MDGFLEISEESVVSLCFRAEVLGVDPDWVQQALRQSFCAVIFPRQLELPTLSLATCDG